MLRIEIVNDGTGPDDAANYRARVLVNNKQIGGYTVLGHNRKHHWTLLVRRLLEEAERHAIVTAVS